ncbi:MAG: hypothetical protein RR324_00915 [Cellulosilyticaceae bacterium]
MKENESNLNVVDVEFISDTNEIIEVESSQGEENNKASREEDLLKEEGQENQNIKKDIKQEINKKDDVAHELKTKSRTQESNQEHQQTHEQTNEPDGIDSRDTSFKSYEREANSKEKLKKRGFFAKLSRVCLSTLGIILAMPVLAAGAIVIIGGLGASLGTIGVGIASVVFTAFLMTVQPGLIGWLGVFVSVGLLSGGGLALCLVILLIRGMKYIVRILRNKDTEADFAVREER